MLYGVFRYVTWFIVFALTINMIRKSKIVRKKFAVILMGVLCLTLCSISFLFPVENLFISFKSPQDVFNYYWSGKIKNIEYGRSSCLVITPVEKNGYSRLIIPKSATGYKIPSMFSIHTILYLFDADGSFEASHVSNTNDYYILATSLTVNEIYIINGNNEQLKTKMKKFGEADLFYSYYNDFTKKCFLLVDGKSKYLVWGRHE